MAGPIGTPFGAPRVPLLHHSEPIDPTLWEWLSAKIDHVLGISPGVTGCVHSAVSDHCDDRCGAQTTGDEVRTESVASTLPQPNLLSPGEGNRKLPPALRNAPSPVSSRARRAGRTFDRGCGRVLRSRTYRAVYWPGFGFSAS